jgi:hypothetical protein
MAKKAPAAKKAASMKIKKGDHVVVIAGKDRGREGTVILAYPDRQRVLVHGVNIIRKNKKVDYQGRRGAKEGHHDPGSAHPREQCPADRPGDQEAGPRGVPV